MAAEFQGLLDHLFRREAGRLVAYLVRSLGPAHLDLAEEVVQDALLQAMRKWPFHGVPDKPGAWLYRVARNLALDRLRRSSTFRDKEDDLRLSLINPAVGPAATPAPDARLTGELTDDQLRLIFLCCHPDVPHDARVALTLKTVGGFSVDEIARGFLASKAAIAQRLVRAQRRIRQRQLPFEVPPPKDLPERLEAVLEVLYLMFNEGYSAHDGDALIRQDLCSEARRLVAELTRLPATDQPQTHALAALLAFQASRLEARLDGDGELVLLDEQDRTLWDRALIRQAFAHIEFAGTGEHRCSFHLEAAIAAHHALAADAAATNWPAILNLYDQLLKLNPSPIVRLNRAVAVARVHGNDVGLEALHSIALDPTLASYHLLHATRGDLLQRNGQQQAALACYQQALACPCSQPERRFLARRIEELSVAS